MYALRPVIGTLAVLVLVAACGTSTPSTAPSPSDAPSDPPSSEPSGAAGGAATWWVGAESIPLAPETTAITGFVMETACASGQSPEGRVNEPVIDYGTDAVIVTFTVTPLAGVQDCPSNPEFPIEFTLSEPLGERTLDGRRNEPAARRDHDPVTRPGHHSHRAAPTPRQGRSFVP